MTITKSLMRPLTRLAALLLLLALPIRPLGAQNGAAPPRFEHMAINVADPRAVVKWYTEHLGFSVLRQGPAPQYSTMIADQAGTMALEIYHNAAYPLLSPDSIHYMSMHLALAVDDVAGVKARLVEAGAKVAEEMKQLPNGDTVLMLRDPWGLPLQIVKRVQPLLK